MSNLVVGSIVFAPHSQATRTPPPIALPAGSWKKDFRRLYLQALINKAFLTAFLHEMDPDAPAVHLNELMAEYDRIRRMTEE